MRSNAEQIQHLAKSWRHEGTELRGCSWMDTASAVVPQNDSSEVGAALRSLAGPGRAAYAEIAARLDHMAGLLDRFLTDTGHQDGAVASDLNKLVPR